MLTGDEQLEREGKVDRAAGNVRQMAGELADDVGKTARRGVVKFPLRLVAVICVLAFSVPAPADDSTRERGHDRDRRIHQGVGPFVDALRLVGEGRAIFRYDWGPPCSSERL